MKKIELPFVRSPHNYDKNEASDQTGLACLDQSLTKQEFKEEANINYIVERYGLTGEIPEVLQLPTYGDYTGIFDYQTAMNSIVKAQQGFMALPAKLRDRFHNEPQKLLEFLNDPDNKEEAIRLGLVNKPQSPVADPGAPDRANPAPDPDKRQEPATTKDKKDKN